MSLLVSVMILLPFSLRAQQLTVSGTVVSKIKTYDGNTTISTYSVGTLQGVPAGKTVKVSSTASVN